ncbi:hypothetical protein N7474_010199 [Penicillium riverlandense]|uniref:uncharacterized protein n=1 Tax=Penicillium riverlandense TaxID=1903569 RepID=UPI002548C897|nr:uncharacterized protein N7474_010199 [Penicillium riverlandense]KAJ5808930.1 hypothetical protein N7474_010199 [Penicillium riverlandense]
MSRTRQPLSSRSLPQTTTETRDSSTLRVSGTLRLRGEDASSTSAEPSPARHIRWSEDVVDNEGMGKKSSKVCCIYHKSRPVGESSSESESSDSSSSDSDSDNDLGPRMNRANHARHSLPRGRGPAPGRPSEGSSGQGRDACCPEHHKQKSKKRKPSPNAYEKMPKPSKSHSHGT